jgi:hypothetical protein
VVCVLNGHFSIDAPKSLKGLNLQFVVASTEVVQQTLYKLVFLKQFDTDRRVGTFKNISQSY